MKCIFITLTILCLISGYAFFTGQAENGSQDKASVEDTFTLNVYGNADLNEVIDQADIDYVSEIINGTAKKTHLADANNDGNIDKADIIFIESIITGEEPNITIIDCNNRTITIKKPVKRIITTCPTAARTISHLDAAKNIVGVDDRTVSNAKKLIFVQAYPELSKLPTIGMWSDPSQETILSLAPDVIFAWDFSGNSESADLLQENTNIPVVCINPDTGSGYNAPGGPYEAWSTAGYIIDKRERAKELIDYCRNEFSLITEITSEISEKDKPEVYLDFVSRGATDISWAAIKFDTLELAGGINVASELDPTSSWGSVQISKEQLIKWNPEIILLHGFQNPKLSKEKIMSDSVLQTITAVKNCRIYYIRDGWMGSDPTTGLAETFYMARIFHPEEFSDIDITSKYNEVLKSFYRADGLYSWLLKESGLYHTWNN